MSDRDLLFVMLGLLLTNTVWTLMILFTFEEEAMTDKMRELADELEKFVLAKEAELAVPESQWGKPPYAGVGYKQYRANWREPLRRARSLIQFVDHLDSLIQRGKDWLRNEFYTRAYIEGMAARKAGKYVEDYIHERRSGMAPDEIEDDSDAAG